MRAKSHAGQIVAVETIYFESAQINQESLKSIPKLQKFCNHETLPHTQHLYPVSRKQDTIALQPLNTETAGAFWAKKPHCGKGYNTKYSIPEELEPQNPPWRVKCQNQGAG